MTPSAGAESVSVNLNTVVDSLAEGPETVTLPWLCLAVPMRPMPRIALRRPRQPE